MYIPDFSDFKCLQSEFPVKVMYMYRAVYICPGVQGWVMISKALYILISSTCEYITLYHKRDLADVIKDLKLGRWPWIIWVYPVSPQRSF